MKKDTFSKDNLMLSIHSDPKNDKILGMYISIEPFTEEDVSELMMLLHKILHRSQSE